MKRIAILAGLALSAAVAHADPVSVTTPRQPVSAEAADAYVRDLDNAVKKVCRDAHAPVYGLSYYAFLDCVKLTRAEVQKQDPTGLYASHESKDAVVIAAR
jgi:hypothetical protein